jgi:large subunit ribosomal protein L24
MKPLVYRKRRRVRGRVPVRAMLHVRRGDVVRVIRGDDRGKEGKILHVHPKTFRVTVEGVNIVKKHKRATTAQGESGIIEFPAPIAASNVMLLDPKSGAPTRVRRRKDADGTVERIAVKSGQAIPRPR